MPLRNAAAEPGWGVVLANSVLRWGLICLLVLYVLSSLGLYFFNYLLIQASNAVARVYTGAFRIRNVVMVRSQRFHWSYRLIPHSTDCMHSPMNHVRLWCFHRRAADSPCFNIRFISGITKSMGQSKRYSSANTFPSMIRSLLFVAECIFRPGRDCVQEAPDPS